MITCFGRVLYKTVTMRSMYLLYLCTKELKPGIQTFKLDKNSVTFTCIITTYRNQNNNCVLKTYIPIARSVILTSTHTISLNPLALCVQVPSLPSNTGGAGADSQGGWVPRKGWLSPFPSAEAPLTALSGSVRTRPGKHA